MEKPTLTPVLGVLDDGHVIVGTSEDKNQIRSPAWAIVKREGYELATYLNRGHAEEKIIAHVQGSLFYFKSRKILALAAGIPICQNCERAIRAAAASRCRSEKRR